MRVIVGTSGYSYKEWKGTFYPEDLSASKMLAFYAQHFRSVEINNTFYRMPEASTLEKWAGEVPGDFVFVLKAPQRITHSKKLAGAEGDVSYFLETAAALGDKFGPVLVQLPPFLKCDVDRLRNFLALFPRNVRVALEFRHASWDDPVVHEVLREHRAALCAADTDEVEDPAKLVAKTADWAYLRLRRTEYSDEQLSDWAKRLEDGGWSESFVFFKHEDEGKGPAFAKRFLALLPH